MKRLSEQIGSMLGLEPTGAGGARLTLKQALEHLTECRREVGKHMGYCMAWDGIEPADDGGPPPFVVFSDDNPHRRALDNAVRRLNAAHSLVKNWHERG